MVRFHRDRELQNGLFPGALQAHLQDSGPSGTKDHRPPVYAHVAVLDGLHPGLGRLYAQRHDGIVDGAVMFRADDDNHLVVSGPGRRRSNFDGNIDGAPFARPDSRPVVTVAAGIEQAGSQHGRNNGDEQRGCAAAKSRAGVAEITAC